MSNAETIDLYIFIVGVVWLGGFIAIRDYRMRLSTKPARLVQGKLSLNLRRWSNSSAKFWAAFVGLAIISIFLKWLNFGFQIHPALVFLVVIALDVGIMASVDLKRAVDWTKIEPKYEALRQNQHGDTLTGMVVERRRVSKDLCEYLVYFELDGTPILAWTLMGLSAQIFSLGAPVMVLNETQVWSRFRWRSYVYRFFIVLEENGSLCPLMNAAT